MAHLSDNLPQYSVKQVRRGRMQKGWNQGEKEDLIRSSKIEKIQKNTLMFAHPFHMFQYSLFVTIYLVLDALTGLQASEDLALYCLHP